MAITLNGSTGITTSGGTVYDQSNVIDTVGQSGGAPTGGIIERGSNANGEYIKFADGTMVATINVVQSMTSTGTLTGSMAYPVAFTDIFSWSWMQTVSHGDSNYGKSHIWRGGTSLTSFYWNVCGDDGITPGYGNTEYSVTIIGTWF